MNRITKSLLGAVAVATIAISMTACDEKAAEVSSKKDDTSKVVVEEAPADEEVVEEAPVEETEEVEPADTTAVVGDTVEIGDWSVKVTEVALNANDAIHRANQFNEKPKGQYVLVTYDATYNGAERIGNVWDLSWSLTGNDNKINDTASVVNQADNESWPYEARKGGTVTGQAVFDVKADLLTGAILSVEGYDENFDSTFADFAL